MNGERADSRSVANDEAEIRTDPITDLTVIVAPGRSRRPGAFSDETSADSSESPFLEGNEQRTPPETFAIRPNGSAPNGPGWLVRVIPNQFPAIRSDAAEPGSRGLHEVIVECPHFERRFTALDETQVRHVLEAYRVRLAAVREMLGEGYGLVFKNSGPAAGATVEHVHSQLLATRHVPPHIRRRVANAERVHGEFGRDPHAIAIDELLADPPRLVFAEPTWIAYCPSAGRFPLECRLVPRDRFTRPESTPETVLDDLAGVLLRLLRGLEASRSNVEYNLVLHTLPFEVPDDVPWFRWWIEVIPRLANFGGYELGGGTFINPIAPETAAETLRKAIDG